MLPVSAWPPGPPGASLSPFGQPCQVNVSCHPSGFRLPKGAWIVRTGSNQVLMRVSCEPPSNPPRSWGTGMLPGSPGPPPCKLPWYQSVRFVTHDKYLESWRAWQRKTGRTGSIEPRPGRTPPNWYGARPMKGQIFTMIPSNSSGTVLSDGSNVVVSGSGCATIIQAFSV